MRAWHTGQFKARKLAQPRIRLQAVPPVIDDLSQGHVPCVPCYSNDVSLSRKGNWHFATRALTLTRPRGGRTRGASLFAVYAVLIEQLFIVPGFLSPCICDPT